MAQRTSSLRKIAWALGAIAMLIALVVVVPQVASASTDQYGFDLSTPKDFDANDGKNPYGNGTFTLDIKSEPMVWCQGDGHLLAKVYNYDSQPGAGSILDNSYKVATVASGAIPTSSYLRWATTPTEPGITTVWG